MSFRVVYSGVWRARIECLLMAAKAAGMAGKIRRAFMQLHEIMESDPVGLGEPIYSLRHVGLTAYVVVRRFVAVKYAVDETNKIVYVMWFSFSGSHPFPPEFEELLNPKQS